MKAYCYKDSKGREVLHAPLMFIVRNYARKEPEVILDIKRLKSASARLKSGQGLGGRVMDAVEIDEEDIEAITELCFANKIDEAKGYCVDVFDYVANKKSGII